MASRNRKKEGKKSNFKIEDFRKATQMNDEVHCH